MLASDLPVCCADKNGELWERCQIATEGIDLSNTREEKKTTVCTVFKATVESLHLYGSDS